MLLDLTGKKILVTGIANNRSIAWGIAQQLSKAGAELGITFLPDEKGRFESKVRVNPRFKSFIILTIRCSKPISNRRSI